MSTAPRLAELTTLRVGGPIARYRRTETEADFIEAIRQADAQGGPLLVLGGGSNVLAADAGFDGVVVSDARRGIRVDDAGACQGANVTVPAGQPWDEVVSTAVANGWSGIEAMAGIPGSTGATPMQNVGAYGQEVAGVIASVRTWDRRTHAIRTLTRSELGFGYRTSILKQSLHVPDSPWFPTPRYVVLEVSFQFRLSSSSQPVRYAELAATLGVAPGQSAPAAAVREAVLALRGGKGMVLDDADHDTWSAGSFFTNPVMSEQAAAGLPPGAPRFEAPDGSVKTSAAWLINAAGFAKGYGLPGPAALSAKHALALTNRGGASAEELLALARTVQAGVRSKFGIELEPEPVVLGGGL